MSETTSISPGELLRFKNNQAAQQLVDEPDRSTDVLDEHEIALREYTGLSAHPEDSSKAITAEYKVATTLKNITLAAGRAIVAPTVAEYLTTCLQANQLILPGSETPLDLTRDQDTISLSIQAHPQPLTDFLLQGATTLHELQTAASTAITSAPDNPYNIFLQASAEVWMRAAEAHNAKKELDEGRGATRTRASRVNPRVNPGNPLDIPRISIIDNLHIVLMALFSADLACHERGITHKDDIAAILLQNIPQFEKFAAMPAYASPYPLPAMDKITGRNDTGTFARMCEASASTGRMVLEDDGTLSAPGLDSTLNGQCPARITVQVAPSERDKLNTLQESLAGRFGLADDWLPRHPTVAGFTFTTVIPMAHETFLGKSAELLASAR